MLLGHKKLAAWYLQLAQHLEAGLPLAGALRLSYGIGVPAADIESTARLIESGGTVDDAFRALRRWLPSADQRFLSAAAEAGRLPRVLRNLSARHAQYSSIKIRIIFACLYPLAILHVGILIFPALHMINWEKGFLWNPAAYTFSVAGMLVPLWSVILILFFLGRRQSPWLGRIGTMLPVFRSYIKAQTLADFSFALGNFLDAGLSIDRAWLAAGLISRSPELMAASESMSMTIEQGQAPGPRLQAEGCFPEDFIGLYRAGESTGQLEQNLLHLASLNQERANHQLKIATLVYPSILFIIVTGIIAYQIVSFYAGYFDMLTHLAS